MTKNKDGSLAKAWKLSKIKQKSVGLKLGEFLTMHFHLFSIFIHKRIKLKKMYDRDKILENVVSNEYHGLSIILS